MSKENKLEDVLPALALLGHPVEIVALDVNSLMQAKKYRIVLVDSRQFLAEAKSLTRLISSTSNATVIPIIHDSNLVALNSDWAINDFILPTISVAELDARLKLNLSKTHVDLAIDPTKLILGDLEVDDKTYTAKIRSKPIDLTYKEFELLKYLISNIGIVFTRSQLLQEVWGYDFFGGTRTVDVHIRRLRAKLGAEYEAIIETVRNVGYKANDINQIYKEKFDEYEEVSI